MAAGRPSKYIPEYAEQAKRLCELGATDSDLAQFFKVQVSTVWYWTTKYPEFSSAVKVGKGAADELVERSLYQRARGGIIKSKRENLDKKGVVTSVEIEYLPPETVACIFWLKNRRPGVWRDKHDVVMNGTVSHTHPLSIADLAAAPSDEVQREYAEALGAAPQMQLIPPATSH